MGHVDAAVTEMFRAVHMQLLGNTCRLEKLLLAALIMETRATGGCSPMGKLPSETVLAPVFGRRRPSGRLAYELEMARPPQGSACRQV